METIQTERRNGLTAKMSLQSPPPERNMKVVWLLSRLIPSHFPLWSWGQSADDTRQRRRARAGHCADGYCIKTDRASVMSLLHLYEIVLQEDAR